MERPCAQRSERNIPWTELLTTLSYKGGRSFGHRSGEAMGMLWIELRSIRKPSVLLCPTFSPDSIRTYIKISCGDSGKCSLLNSEKQALTVGSFWKSSLIRKLDPSPQSVWGPLKGPGTNSQKTALKTTFFRTWLSVRFLSMEFKPNSTAGNEMPGKRAVLKSK